MNIATAWDRSCADPALLRSRYSVVIEKTARELGGTPCLALEDPDPPEQAICCSRMLGERFTEIALIRTGECVGI
jgi:DNA polymerase V